MRCFTITSSAISGDIKPYLEVVAKPYPHVGVGEEGRGRKYVRFPLGQRLAESLADYVPCPRRGHVVYWNNQGRCPDCGTVLQKGEGEGFLHPDFGEVTKYGQLERASVLKTHKGTLLLIEEKDPADKRALVLVSVEGGFRGSTDWTAATSRVVPCPERGRANAEFTSCCSKCGVDYPAKNDELLLSDENIHPEEGFVKVYGAFPPAGITVLAEGYGAEGAAGRAGGPHWARLVIMEPGSVFRVRRYGRLYGGPKECYVAWDGELLRVGTWDELNPPGREDEVGVLI